MHEDDVTALIMHGWLLAAVVLFSTGLWIGGLVATAMGGAILRNYVE